MPDFESGAIISSTTFVVQGTAGETTAYGYTNQRADSNRVVSGRGDVPNSSVLDVSLNGIPVWLAAAPSDSGSIWTVVLEDGRVSAFFLEGGRIEEIAAPEPFPHPVPPLLRVTGGRPHLVLPPGDDLGMAPPAVLDEEGNWVYIAPGGDLVFMDASERELDRLAVSALPDGRILVDERQRLLLLTQPTDRYSHGVLGDKLEAGGVTLIQTKPEIVVLSTILVAESQVIEGIAPLWFDLNEDGQREIILTVSDADQGAQIVVYDEDGHQLAPGPPVGLGYRWRHQLSVAPFGPNGEMELAAVLTPHIGGVVEFYRLEGTELRIVAQLPGFTSHIIGSRNLDMPVAGDFDGDGRVELLLPTQDRTIIGAIRRVPGGAEVAWRLPLEGRLSTNLAAVVDGEGKLILGAGQEDGMLRLWPSS